MSISEDTSRQFHVLVAQRLGLDIPATRQADLERAITGNLQVAHDETPEICLARMTALTDESPEWRKFASVLTVGETYFFRDRPCMDALEKEVLPALIASRREKGGLWLRLWSAACATGEEAYSLAIMLDRLLPDLSDWSVTILATDLNTEALETARLGLYRSWSFRDTPPDLRDSYFESRAGETYELRPSIRQMVTFAPLNLAQDGYPSPVTSTGSMDVILCRNVFMYLTQDAQRATAARLQRALVPGGWLVVSPAEASAERFSPLETVNFPGAIFFCKGEGADAGEPTTTLESAPAAEVLPSEMFRDDCAPGYSPLMAGS